MDCTFDSKTVLLGSLTNNACS